MHYYVPIAQSLQLPRWMVPGAIAEGLLIRKRADIDLSAEEIRAAVTGGRTDLPFVGVQPYAATEGPRLQHWVIGTQLLLLFGALALATATMGMYAALAHSVVERRQEIAVRLAVGASRQRVLVMMLREGAVVAVRGAINGVLVATLVGWAAQSLIFGLSSPGLLVSGAAIASV
jgi:ABC-type antimicrobial peptide transport system permease subunit